MQKYLLWLSHNKCQLVVILLISIGLYFRFHNFPVKYAFDFDPSRDALIAYYGSRNVSFPLVGASSGIGEFSFGPWYYWQIILVSMILPTVWAPWIYVGVFSLAFMWVMYKIGEILEGKLFGVILLFLATFSPAQVGPTSGLSNPNLVPLHAALTIYIALLFMQKKPSVLLAFLWGAIIGIGISNHFQMLLLLVVPGLVFLVKREQRVKRIALFCSGLLVTFLPTIIFNVLTQWKTVKEFSNFLLSSGNTNYVPNSWKIYLGEFWPQFFSYVLGVPMWLLIVVLLIAGILIIQQGIKRNIPRSYWVLGISFVCIAIILRYYSGERQYYYLLFLHPFLFIFTAYPMYLLSKHKITLSVSIVLIVLIGFFATPQSLQRGNPREENTSFREIAEKVIMQTHGSSVALYNCEKMERNRAQGVAFFLLEKGVRLDKNGTKIGIANGDCLDSSQGEKKVTIQRLSEPVAHMWVSVTPEEVYKETVGWWY